LRSAAGEAAEVHAAADQRCRAAGDRAPDRSGEVGLAAEMNEAADQAAASNRAAACNMVVASVADFRRGPDRVPDRAVVRGVDLMAAAALGREAARWLMDPSVAAALDPAREDLDKRAARVRDQERAQRPELPRPIAMRANLPAPKVLLQVLPLQTATRRVLPAHKGLPPELRSPIVTRHRPPVPRARLLVQRSLIATLPSLRVLRVVLWVLPLDEPIVRAMFRRLP